MSSRVSVRLDDETEKQIEELIERFQKGSISKITVSDVIRKAVETLHEVSTVGK